MVLYSNLRRVICLTKCDAIQHIIDFLLRRRPIYGHVHYCLKNVSIEISGGFCVLVSRHFIVAYACFRHRASKVYQRPHGESSSNIAESSERHYGYVAVLRC